MAQGIQRCMVVKAGKDAHFYWACGELIENDRSEIGPALDDVGLDDPPGDGIWIFEGKLHGGGRTFEGDYADTYYRGVFRTPTRTEWEAITIGLDPFAADRAQNALDREVTP